MKLSKITIVILGVVVLGVAAGLLYMQHAKQQDEQAQLRAKIAANQATVSRLAAEGENWQAQLTRLQGQIAQKKAAVTTANMSLTAAKAEWPNDAQSIEYDEAIFGLADSWNLDISAISAGEPAAKQVQGIGFTNTTFTVTVTGKALAADQAFDDTQKYQAYLDQVVGNILGFINVLAKDAKFSHAQIDTVSLSVPEMPPLEEIISQGTKVAQPSASITVTVYTYKGG
jgi:hypothetical protein